MSANELATSHPRKTPETGTECTDIGACPQIPEWQKRQSTICEQVWRTDLLAFATSPERNNKARRSFSKPSFDGANCMTQQLDNSSELNMEAASEAHECQTNCFPQQQKPQALGFQQDGTMHPRKLHRVCVSASESGAPPSSEWVKLANSWKALGHRISPRPHPHQCFLAAGRA